MKRWFLLALLWACGPPPPPMGNRPLTIFSDQHCAVYHLVENAFEETNPHTVYIGVCWGSENIAIAVVPLASPIPMTPVPGGLRK